MSVLQSRIASGQYNAAGNYHPASTPATPMEMPMSEVVYAGDTVLYGTLHPVVAPNGATIAARPAPWPSPQVPGVAPAGRP